MAAPSIFLLHKCQCGCFPPPHNQLAADRVGFLPNNIPHDLTRMPASQLRTRVDDAGFAELRGCVALLAQLRCWAGWCGAVLGIAAPALCACIACVRPGAGARACRCRARAARRPLLKFVSWPASCLRLSADAAAPVCVHACMAVCARTCAGVAGRLR